MVAQKKAVENSVGICPICSTQDNLPHFYSPENANICDECYTKLHHKPLPLDEYDLRPDEMTKEQFADKAGVGLRAVEIWKKQGKIQAQKLRRRVDGVVRQQLIFTTGDVEEFLSKSNEAVNLPKVEKEFNQLEKTNDGENFGNSQMFANQFMNMFAHTLQNPNLLPGKEEPPFMTVKEAAEFSHLSESCLRQLAADGTLTKFTGKHGETMISRKQLLNL